MAKTGQRKGWFNTAGKSVMRCQCAVSPFCPAVAEGEPSGSCWMGTFFSYSVKNSKECAKGMCEEREEEEICPFPQIFYSLDIFSFLLTFSLAFFSCLFLLLGLLSSPLSRSPSHYLTFTISLLHLSSLYCWHVQCLLTCSSVCCSFPPSLSCHSPVIICNLVNKRKRRCFLPFRAL